MAMGADPPSGMAMGADPPSENILQGGIDKTYSNIDKTYSKHISMLFEMHIFKLVYR